MAKLNQKKFIFNGIEWDILSKESGELPIQTDENGEFYISGFIPGDYTLTYTWGDETYTVTNYKGTIYKGAGGT